MFGAAKYFVYIFQYVGGHRIAFGVEGLAQGVQVDALLSFFILVVLTDIHLVHHCSVFCITLHYYLMFTINIKHYCVMLKSHTLMFQITNQIKVLDRSKHKMQFINNNYACDK